MDQSPKPPDGSAILEELKQALEGAARCIELAKQEGARADAALRAQSSGGAKAEQALLDNARKGREQLSVFDLRLELPPPCPPVETPAAPPSVDEKSVIEEALLPSVPLPVGL